MDNKLNQIETYTKENYVSELHPMRLPYYIPNDQKIIRAWANINIEPLEDYEKDKVQILTRIFNDENKYEEIIKCNKVSNYKNALIDIDLKDKSIVWWNHVYLEPNCLCRIKLSITVELEGEY